MYKLFLLLNEYGDSTPALTILFQNLSLYNINNQSVKFDKNDLTAGSISKNEL